MDSMEFNKIAGAVLSALLIIFGGSTLIHELNASHGKHKPAYQLVSADASAEGSESATATEAEAGFSYEEVASLLATASADAGKAKFRQCSACHTVNEGGANRVGPNLWNVVDRDKGSIDGFRYSSAMAEKEGNWSYENLALFLHDPKGWMPGTKMVFRGIAKPQDVANMLAYLRSLSSAPKPLPSN
ncbi:MAG: cytochrome c family protein [Pseudomonadota bacterium]